MHVVQAACIQEYTKDYNVLQFMYGISFEDYTSGNIIKYIHMVQVLKNMIPIKKNMSRVALRLQSCTKEFRYITGYGY